MTLMGEIELREERKTWVCAYGTNGGIVHQVISIDDRPKMIHLSIEQTEELALILLNAAKSAREWAVKGKFDGHT